MLDRQSKKHKVTFPLPILITHIIISWMLENENNEMYKVRVMIAIESKIASYFASLQIEEWTEKMAHAYIHIVRSESSKEEEDDDHFFEQEPPKDNRKFMIKI